MHANASVNLNERAAELFAFLIPLGLYLSVQLVTSRRSRFGNQREA
jgi:hypothetical protein